MSRRNENVDNAIWQDEPFSELSAAGKLTYMWSWTNLLCGMSGLYKVRTQQIELDTAQTRGTVEGALAELREQCLLCYVEGMVWVVARASRLVTKTPQIAKSVANDVARVPSSHPLRTAFLGWYWETKWPGDALRETFGVEGQPRVTRGSLEGHEKPFVIEELLRVNRGSPDPPVAVAVVDAFTSVVPQTAVARDPFAELPAELRQIAALVAEKLGRVAEAKSAKPIQPGAVVRVLLDFPDHDHRKEAGEFEHYWRFGDGQRTKRSDVVATYRRRLASVVPGRRNGVIDDPVERILAYGQGTAQMVEGSVAE